MVLPFPSNHMQYVNSAGIHTFPLIIHWPEGTAFDAMNHIALLSLGWIASYHVTKWTAIPRVPSCWLELLIVVLFPWHAMPGRCHMNSDTKGFYMCCGCSCYGCGWLFRVNTNWSAPVDEGACVSWCCGGWWWRCDGEQNKKKYLHSAFTKLTCSCDPSGFPAARRQLWPGPAVRRSGSTWAACPTDWPRRLARRTRSPSTSSGPAFPGETVQTGSCPAGSLSPGSHWLQTSWQRRWAAPFAAEGQGGREGVEQGGKAGRDEIKRRKKGED